MSNIKIHCQGCIKDFEVIRTEEIPDDVTSLICNWCPSCQDTAKDYYKEEYRYFKVEDKKDINQQSLF